MEGNPESECFEIWNRERLPGRLASKKKVNYQTIQKGDTVRIIDEDVLGTVIDDDAVVNGVPGITVVDSNGQTYPVLEGDIEKIASKKKAQGRYDMQIGDALDELKWKDTIMRKNAKEILNDIVSDKDIEKTAQVDPKEMKQEFINVRREFEDIKNDYEKLLKEIKVNLDDEEMMTEEYTVDSIYGILVLLGELNDQIRQKLPDPYTLA